MPDAVSDSSPLIHLAKIEVLELISRLYSLVLTCLATAGKTDGLPALGGAIVSKQQNLQTSVGRTFTARKWRALSETGRIKG